MKTVKLALIAAGVALMLVLISQFSEMSTKRSLERALGNQTGYLPNQRAMPAQMQSVVPGAGYGQGGGGPMGGSGAVVVDESTVRQAEIEAAVSARMAELEERFGEAAEVNAVKDAELARLQDELAILQEERVMMSKQIDQIETAKFVEKQLEEQSLTDAERRIRRAVPICRVTSFEKEYGFVTLDGGKTQMLAAGSKLAIRRGNDVVAELIISSVELDSAVADVLDFNAEPPKQGDEVIAWPF
ncbi:MAG: hypothetical protein AAGD22_10240 [Verrucomicrobiota bacterium]